MQNQNNDQPNKPVKANVIFHSDSKKDWINYCQRNNLKLIPWIINTLDQAIKIDESKYR